MGIVQRTDKDRDKALIADYLKKNKDGSWKFTITELGLKYARLDGIRTIPLSTTRIHQILNKYDVKKERAKAAK
jgi:hypothetical protein